MTRSPLLLATLCTLCACEFVDLFRSRSTPPELRSGRRARPHDIEALSWRARDATLRGAPPVLRVDPRPIPEDAYTATGEFTETFAHSEAHAVFERTTRDAAAAHARAWNWVVSERAWQVNAATRCTARAAQIEVSQGIISLAAALASTRALDERTGSHVFEAYCDALAHLLRRGGVVVAPRIVDVPTTIARDPWKLTRQRQLFNDIMTFVVAHEVGHVMLGHGRCVPDAGRVHPGGQHTREFEADAWATDPARSWAMSCNSGARVLLSFYARWEQIAEDAGVVPHRSHPRAAQRLERLFSCTTTSARSVDVLASRHE